MKTLEIEETSGKVKKKVFWSQWVAALIVSLILFLAGLCNGWASPYLAKLSLLIGIDGIAQVTTQQLSWLAALINVGRIGGVIIGTVLQDITSSRKLTLYYAGLPMTTGWICITLAQSVYWLYAARLLWGFGMGMMWCALAHYLAEIADPQIRGSLVLWNFTTQLLGVFLGNLMGPYLPMKVYAFISIVFNMLYLIVFYFVPDTPYRYIASGDLVMAEKSLIWFRRTNDVKKELQELQDYIKSSRCTMKDRWKEAKEPRHRNSFLLLALVNVFIYFGANHIIINYTEIILTRSKIDVTPSTIVTACGLSSVLSSLLATFLVDRFGRRALIITSSVGVAISLTTLGTHFKLLDLDYDPVALTWLPVTCIFVYTVFYNLGISCIPTTLVGELFSPRLKSVASFNFSTTAALFASLMTGTFLPFINAVGEFCFFLFYSAGVYVSIVYYYFYLPETKGKSLKDIQSER